MTAQTLVRFGIHNALTHLMIWTEELHCCELNLPVIQDDKMIIHVAKGNSIEPIFILCDDKEKLRSVQLALEYTLLLTMPFTSLKYDRNVC